MAGPGGVRSITFHHPIGVTPLDAKTWIATMTVEIQDLLARRVDPGAASIEAARAQHRLASAGRLGLLNEDDDGEVVYPDNPEIVRQSALSDARAALKRATQKGVKPAPDAFLAFMPEGIRTQEIAVRAHLSLPATVAAAVTAIPASNFQTKSGPLADRVQSAVAYLNNKSRAEAEDTVARRLFN
jgi:hypothetical protein